MGPESSPKFIFRQLFDQQLSTDTYLLADGKSGEAVIIDPVFEQAHRDAMPFEELDLRVLYTLHAHVHADLVTGTSMPMLRTGAQIAVSALVGMIGADRNLVAGDEVSFGGRHSRRHAHYAG